MGTFGELFLDNDPLCHLAEQPDNHNTPFHSCVPAGLYELVSVSSPKYGETFCLYNPELNVVVSKAEMKNRLTRYGCLIHAANKPSQLQGCIAPGDSLGFLDGEWAVLNSRETLARILPLLKTEKYVLIKPVE